MQGKPKNMQNDTDYKDVQTDVLQFFEEKLIQLQSKDIFDIVVDPGFGFGKTVDQNYELLVNLSAFRVLGFPILAGVSRKSMIWKTLNVKPDEALNGTTALHMVALEQGARILRVHDVAAASEVIKLRNKIKKAGGIIEPDF
jgi:dihydropteroate synthase